MRTRITIIALVAAVIAVSCVSASAAAWRKIAQGRHSGPYALVSLIAHGETDFKLRVTMTKAQKVGVAWTILCGHNKRSGTFSTSRLDSSKVLRKPAGQHCTFVANGNLGQKGGTLTLRVYSRT
jgi:hypothetical protein